MKWDGKWWSHSYSKFIKCLVTFLSKPSLPELKTKYNAKCVYLSALFIIHNLTKVHIYQVQLEEKEFLQLGKKKVQLLQKHSVAHNDEEITKEKSTFIDTIDSAVYLCTLEDIIINIKFKWAKTNDDEIIMFKELAHTSFPTKLEMFRQYFGSIKYCLCEREG